MQTVNLPAANGGREIYNTDETSMKRQLTILIIAFGSLVLLARVLGSCRKNDNPNNLHLLSLPVPDGFPQPLNRFADNPLSEEGIALGKKLFYDGRLSKDGLYPCASCHQQIAGFGTYEHDRSHGYNGSHTLRNAPVLFNLAWQDRFHWDGEFNSLYSEAVQPITGHIEMAESFQGVMNKLQSDAEYRKMFKKVFRTEFIAPDHILKALEQFTGTLVSGNSRYDRYKKGVLNFTADEEAGYQLYKAKCATCHPEPLFTDYSYRNIGLPVDPLLNDYGRMRITGLAGDSLRFKVPTLRNVDVSSNYMHDGRFNTLAQCISHYRSGVQAGPNVDPLVAGGITTSTTETNQLIRFLRTLTDSAFLKDPALGRP